MMNNKVATWMKTLSRYLEAKYPGGSLRNTYPPGYQDWPSPEVLSLDELKCLLDVDAEAARKEMEGWDWSRYDSRPVLNGMERGGQIVCRRGPDGVERYFIQ